MPLLETIRSRCAAGVLALLSAAPAGAQAARLPGVRFTVDTIERPAAWRGPLTPFVGTVEYAAGRGRVDVTAVRRDPAVAVNGVTMAAPLARPGDYYLFDSTGFTLVRPAARTFSRFALSRTWANHAESLLPGEVLMPHPPLAVDTLTGRAAARRRERVPITIRMHLDRRHASGRTPIARAWLDVPAAAPGEASVVRWFGAARMLAAVRGGVGTLPADSMQLTSAVLLHPLGDGRARVNLTTEYALAGIRAVEIDPARLVVPRGYAEVRAVAPAP